MAKKANEIYITRLYDAPVKLVWEAWTDLEHVAKWWGPRGFTITTKSKDLRPGGKWIYTMHGPDGVDYPNITTYHEVEKYKKLVYDHGGNEERPKLFTVVVNFEEQKGKTLMSISFALPSEEEAKAMKKFIKAAGGNGTWDRLGEYLEQESSGKDSFIINRSFAADQKTLFDMWVKPEHLSRWLAPKGSSLSFLRTNVEEGGSSHYAMKHAEGGEMYGMLHYKRIQPHDLLIYTQNFSDKDGKLIKPAFAPSWPDQMLTTVTFASEGPQETRVTVKWEIHGNASAAERQTFHDAKAGMTGGWTGSFDKLEELL
jgi:uncharacterized protein YndB with AHSA1/START domain